MKTGQTFQSNMELEAGKTRGEQFQSVKISHKETGW